MDLVLTKRNLIAITSIQMFLLGVVCNFGSRLIDFVGRYMDFKYDLAISIFVVAFAVGILNNPTYKRLKVE